MVLGLICYATLAAALAGPRVPFAAGYGLVPVTVLSLLLVAAQAVTAITAERDGGALDLLLVTDLTPKEFIFGKIWGVLFNTREARNDASGFAYTSFDGGRTWRNVQLPKLTFQTGATGQLNIMDSAGDPAIAFGPHDTVYYANLVFSRATVPASCVSFACSSGEFRKCNTCATFGSALRSHSQALTRCGRPNCFRK